MRNLYYFLFITLIVSFFLSACGRKESWTKYELRVPEFVQCKDATEAQHLAYLYMIQVNGLEIQHVPASFSMSKTLQTNDWYVIESVPFAEAGGYPIVFFRDNTKRGRIFHWAIARNAKDELVTAGDSPRNQLDDKTLGIAEPVGPDRYVGAVKKVFTYPRP